MAAPSQTRSGLTLEKFLRMPEIDEAPYVEFLDGRAETKAMPTSRHALIQKRLIRRLDDFVEPRGLGLVLRELRHTFAGRSIVPDISFLLDENLVLDDRGIPSGRVLVPPDIHIEILSPDQSLTKTHARLVHSTSHGCSLGVLVDPDDKTIDVYRPGLSAERLAEDSAIDFGPVLPGLAVTVGEVFSWMVVRVPRPKSDSE